jgi:hypothetical protein
MIRSFSSIQRGEDKYIGYTSDCGKWKFELPFIENETAEESTLRINEMLVGVIIGGLSSNQCVDFVYVDKEIVREDFSINTEEGQVLLAKLETEFPNFTDYRRQANNMVAEYDGYRAPYSNPSLSFYDFQIIMPPAIQTAFNVSYQASELKTWYGLKFDLVTRDVLLKAVVLDFAGAKPDLPPSHPIWNNYYALTHSADGSVSDWVDCYSFSTRSQIKQFCLDKGLDYPLPDEEDLEPGYQAIWNWGVVFNKSTLEYGPVKAYVRYYLTDISKLHSLTTK